MKSGATAKPCPCGSEAAVNHRPLLKYQWQVVCYRSGCKKSLKICERERGHAISRWNTDQEATQTRVGKDSRQFCARCGLSEPHECIGSIDQPVLTRVGESAATHGRFRRL
jgi:hypothetical protein